MIEIHNFFAKDIVKNLNLNSNLFPTTKVYNLVVPVRFPNIIVVSSILVVPFPLPLSTYVIEENQNYFYSKSMWSASNFANSSLLYLEYIKELTFCVNSL